LWFRGVLTLEVVGVANLWGVLSVLPAAVSGVPGSFWWCGGGFPFFGTLRALLTEEVGEAGLLDEGVLLVI